MTDPQSSRISSEGAVQPERLDRSLGAFSLFILAFGTIIGIGWVTVVGVWIADGGSIGAVVAFVIGGLIIAPIALCYAEIAGMYPVSGGELAYIYEMYGERMSFIAGWLLAYLYIATTSFEAVAVAWVLSAMFPGMEGPVLYSFLGSDVMLWSLAVGLAIMALITVVNYYGAKSAAGFQTAFVFILCGASAIFIIAGLMNAEPRNLEPVLAGDTAPSAFFGVLAVLATTPFWFAGFDTIPQAMGEVRDRFDLKILPRVMLFAIVSATIFYALIILTASMAVDRAELLSFNLPLAGAAEAALGSPWLRQLVLFAGLCGLLTTWNAVFYAATRVVFALSRARMIPHAFAKVHARHGAPGRAVIFVGVIGGLGALMGREAINLIVGSASLVFALLFALVVFGVLLLRRRLPDHPRPYKFPGGVAGLGLVFLLAAGVFILAAVAPLIASNGAVPFEWLLIAGWGVAGAVFYAVSAPMRRAVTARERRYLILDE